MLDVSEIMSAVCLMQAEGKGSSYGAPTSFDAAMMSVRLLAFCLSYPSGWSIQHPMRLHVHQVSADIAQEVWAHDLVALMDKTNTDAICKCVTVH